MAKPFKCIVESFIKSPSDDIESMIRDEVRSAVSAAISAINKLKNEIKKKRVV